ncbi:MAG: hypothetical protein JNK15_12850, partial [Planctomycetes bacterium]|nr:hypothetical protein [Planctomycetota bacterium]
GGAAPPAPVGTETRLQAAPQTIGPAVTTVELVVDLASVPAAEPTLLQVAVELPPQLTFAASNRLLPARTLATLDGDFVDARFVVMCGDAQNVPAAALGLGPLFKLRLQPTSPRVPGTWQVRLHHLRASTRDGQPVAVDPNPAVVDVVVQ